MVGLSPPVNLGLNESIDIMGQVFELLIHPICDSFEKFFIYHDLIGIVEWPLNLFILVKIYVFHFFYGLKLLDEVLVVLVQRVKLHIKKVGIALFIMANSEPNMIKVPQNLLFGKFKHPIFDF